MAATGHLLAAAAAHGHLLPAALPVAAAGQRGKRLFDVVVAVPLLVLLAPALALIALAIVLDSRGPSLFRQPRMGRHRPFVVWKFRTMVRDADAATLALQAQSKDPNWLHLERDPRVTRVGGLLRRTSLDELPQLVNVLRGEMSLVGPRPLSLRDEGQVPSWAAPRRLVRPGMTGPWQVSGRTQLPFEAMLRLDCEYVERWSWRRDLQILLRTLPAVMTGRGAN